MIFRKPSFSENILAFLKRYNHVDVFADEEEKEKYKTERKFIDLCEEVNQKIAKFIAPVKPIAAGTKEKYDRMIVIRVIKGSSEGYTAIVVRTYACQTQEFFGGLWKKKYWVTIGSENEVIELKKLPELEEYVERFRGVCGDEVTIRAENAHINEYYYVF